ncbi:glucose-6-phosphate isomerase [Gymnodinialimonas hymeniacidonis]|uniref:glucose-6-phosphate isomerase n=1 Tax=Gymnodinialimonas hymeniacidonis TaxID=3126508 RepID=UPI0034C60300
MSDMSPTTIDFDTVTGASEAADPLTRTLKSLDGYFYDADAFSAAMAEDDALIYEYFDMGVPETSGNVAYGTTSIKPGKVGDEYFMTKGHFHTVLDTAEVYYCLSGHGGMMMETPEGKVEWREMKKGDVVYVPGRWAHRSINISATEPFVMFFAFPGHAGHDYGTIATKGFRKLMVERDGKPTMVDNPRWNG